MPTIMVTGSTVKQNSAVFFPNGSRKGLFPLRLRVALRGVDALKR